ncbi:DUF6456 domain-containing protein [Bradyrhizobium diazoefficiens]
MATDLLRNALVAPIEVDDPYEAGEKIAVMRSLRNDPLAGLHSRQQIDEAQYTAGRYFQRDFEMAERGPKAIDPSKEAVDGGMMPEPITESQQRAAQKLAEVYRALGPDLSALLHDVLIGGMVRAQLAAKRGLAGREWEEFFGRRFREGLDGAAVVYGLAQVRVRPDRRPAQISADQ